MKKNFIFCFLFALTWIFSQSVQLFDPATGTPYPDTLYFCAGENFKLEVDAKATSTGDYAVTKNLQSAYPQLTAGSTPIVLGNSGTDKFSSPIPIGFTFSFYGKDYTRVVAGSNGRLVFTNDAELQSLNDITIYQDRTFSGNSFNSYSVLPSTDYNKVYRNNPTQELNLAQIFFGYTDLVTQPQSPSVRYLYRTNVMVGGQRALLVSFQNMIHTDTRGAISSSTYDSFVLLLENGQIIVDVRNKTEDTYNAILGLQNDNATKSKVPQHSTIGADYNNGRWKSENIVWTFTPNQNLTPQFKWTRNGTAIAGQTAKTFNTTALAPGLADGDRLKVEVTYHDDAGNQIGNPVTDEILFKSLQKPVVTESGDGACTAGISLSVPADPALDYEWFRTGNATVLGTGNTYYANQSGSYFVRSKRNFSPGCALDSDPVAVSLNSTLPPFNAANKPLYYCENIGVVPKSFNLFDFYPADPSKYTVKFLYNGNEILDPSDYDLPPNVTVNIKLEVKDLTSTCELNHTFTLRYDALPFPLDVTESYCFGLSSINASDYLKAVAGLFIDKFDYLYSVDGTSFTPDPLFNPKINPKIWIKILPKNPPAGSCETISTITFAEQAKVIANTPTTPLPPQCTSQTETFDLASLIPEINPGNVTVTFHKSMADAQTGQNAVPYNFRSGLGDTVLYIRVEDNTTRCVSPDHPQITLTVYYKPTLKIKTISKTNCTGNNFFNLSQNPSDLTTASSPVTVALEYYSENGTLLTAAQVSNYDASQFGLKPYIKIIYNPTCGDVVNFDLGYYPKPAAQIAQILICSEVTFSLQNFKDAVIANASQYSFTDDLGQQLPASFDVTSLPKTIKFIIKDNATGCFSDVQTVTFVKGTPVSLLNTEADYTLCDTDFDGITAFDLNSKKSDFTADATAKFEYFKDSGYSQSIPSDYVNETAFTQPVYVKVSIPNYCPAYGKINLKVNIPVKSTTLLDKYFICYGETLKIDAGPENTVYTWSDGQNSRFGTFTAPGSYSVILKQGINGCPYTHEFTISDENQPRIEVINQTNNSIEVIATGGQKPYTYYFNGVPQSSNVLVNPTASTYEIQVKSASGCLGPPKSVYFIKINNAFSPNADGLNDTWKIENLDKMQEVSIIIADRQGTKVFESTNPSKTEWDGKSGGRALPTATYWYTVSWFDAVTQKREQRQGWILLKNRN